MNTCMALWQCFCCGNLSMSTGGEFIEAAANPGPSIFVHESTHESAILILVSPHLFLMLFFLFVSETSCNVSRRYSRDRDDTHLCINNLICDIDIDNPFPHLGMYIYIELVQFRHYHGFVNRSIQNIQETGNQSKPCTTSD